MSIHEASIARARSIFTTRRCVDTEDVGQAIPCQGEELVLAGLCPLGHSLCPGSAIGKLCDVCKLDCPRTAWSWECQRCDVFICPACMAASLRGELSYDPKWEIRHTTKTETKHEDASHVLSKGAEKCADKASRTKGREQSGQGHTPETLEYGVSSVVFRRHTKPFHPARLKASS
eukprot:4086195-Amphidinium_carterae.1